LIVNRVSLSEAAKRLDVPYNSLRFQARTQLTQAEWEKVDRLRERTSYSRQFKVEVMREAIKLEKVYHNEGFHRPWGRAFKEVAKKHKIPVEILYAWRKAFLKELHPDRKRQKGPMDEREEAD